jgi:uncharacterized repeat protein (TIGR03803 family)
MISSHVARISSKLSLLALLLLTALAKAQTFTTLHNFTGGSDGGQPQAGLIENPTGELYGTTVDGGIGGNGVVYAINTAGVETVIYEFTRYPNGADPVAPVVLDSNGNVYGTAFQGGSTNCSSGCGTVFKIDSSGNESVLYAFTGAQDGCAPYQGLIMDESGSLYGTTWQCGSSGYGTIYKVDAAGKFTVLHTFTGGPSDGASPLYGHLTMDETGNLYGVTSEGGAGTACQESRGCGVLYEFTRRGTFTLLHTFGLGSDGCIPYGSVARGERGELYGTTWECDGSGTIWKVSTKDKEEILHSFAGGASDGCYPQAGVTRDVSGNLYGVTYFCGANGDGALFELSPNRSFTLLHSFDGSEGSGPVGEVLRTANGTLFGTTVAGGTDDLGTAWSYTP